MAANAAKYPTPNRIAAKSKRAGNATSPKPRLRLTHQTPNLSILGDHHEYPIIKRLDEQLCWGVADEPAELERVDRRGEGPVGNVGLGRRLGVGGDGVGFFEERRHGEGAAKTKRSTEL
jgi:hypothetical protein